MPWQCVIADVGGIELVFFACFYIQTVHCYTTFSFIQVRPSQYPT